MKSFSELALSEPLARALRDEGYEAPTPIQVQAIPPLLEGADLLGCARTGTGKTAAFALPILQRLFANRRPALRKSPRVLVVVPTRELASQVAQSFTTYGRHLRPNVAVIFGGVGQSPQVRAMAHGVDVLVATPGRLLDLMGQGHVRLDGVETLVLDEADQMLDLGFLPDVKRILGAVPPRRQTLLFSATMPAPIEQLAQRILRNPVKVYVTPVASTVELVDQRVQFVSRDDKPDVLTHLLRDPSVSRVLVFTRTKRGCDRVAKRLVQNGIQAQAIHGDKSQGNRERSLAGFRSGKVRVLVATDIAARGIDIDDISHVVNYEIPNVPETYVHRIGRTARAGAAGVAISLCAPEERAFVRDIEKLMRRSIAVIGAHPAEAHGRRAPTHGKPQPASAKAPARERQQEERAGRHGHPQRPVPGRTQTGHAPRQPRAEDSRPGQRDGGRGGQGTRRSPHHGGRGHARLEVHVARSESEQKLDTFGTGL
ncbi:MAG: DEAD/DEAH box helicase [Planctomycetes bacterium]|nr:DEAD/DEAH box helicase [Planctomycetota bacterium]